MLILPAVSTDSDILTTITKQSKAYWGYSKAQMAEWASELTIMPDYIEQNTVYKLVPDSEPVAYYSLHAPVSGRAKLENLFVLPACIGRGFGELLLEHALSESAAMEGHTLWLESDPHAMNFYLKNGFEIIGQEPSSIPGRFLPVMERKL